MDMQVNRKGLKVEFASDAEKIQKILDYKIKLGQDFPKIGVFVICYNASVHISKTLKRIPKDIYPAIHEVFIFDDASPDNTYELAKNLRNNNEFSQDLNQKLNIYKNPVNLGYGGNQKVGYRYAIGKGLDYVIMLHGDGQYAPEYIPDLILPIFENKAQVVFGSRMANSGDALKGGMPLYKWLGNKVLTQFENFILGTKLTEFHSGYRMYSTNVLSRIPFEENTNVFHFDTEIIIQCRALGVPIDEVPIKTFYGDEVCNVNGMKYAKDVCVSVLKYRMHQLHLLRLSCYLVKKDVQYTRKISPYSSHEQMLTFVKKKGKALDFGSSSGLLLSSLEQMGMNVTAIDGINFEEYKNLKFQREYDYLVLSDVVSKIKDSMGFLKYIQRFLKEDGRILICVPNIAIWFYRFSLLIGRFYYGPKGPLDESHVRLYTKNTIIQLVERSGYIITEIRPTSLPFEVVFESVGKSRFLKFIDSIYFVMAKIWPTLFSYQFIVEAKITSFVAHEGEGKL